MAVLLASHLSRRFFFFLFFFVAFDDQVSLCTDELCYLRPHTLVCATALGLSLPSSYSNSRSAHKNSSGSSAKSSSAISVPFLSLTGTGILGLPLDPASVVQKRSVASGLSDSLAAAEALSDGDFDACRAAIARARASFAWFQKAKQKHGSNNNQDEDSDGGGGSGGGRDEELAALDQAGDTAAAEVSK